MSESSRIPQIIISLKLPKEIGDVVGSPEFGSLDREQALEAFRTVYALGFYDGSTEGPRLDGLQQLRKLIGVYLSTLEGGSDGR